MRATWSTADTPAATALVAMARRSRRMSAAPSNATVATRGTIQRWTDGCDIAVSWTSSQPQTKPNPAEPTWLIDGASTPLPQSLDDVMAPGDDAWLC
jgi:hypothetical protein